MYALALDQYLPAVAGVCAEEGAQQFGAARAQHPGNAEDFAFVEFEAHIGEGVLARQALHLQHRDRARLQIIRPLLLRDCAEHHLHDLRDARLPHRHRANVMPVAQDRDSVGDRVQFL